MPEPLGKPKATGAARVSFHSQLRRLGFENYSEYTRSTGWRARRDAYYADPDTPKACLCGETEGLDLHHLTYERLGNEQPEDLHPLCRGCHVDVHLMARRGLMSIDLQGYVSDLRRARYGRERNERLRRDGGAVAEEGATPFAPDQWSRNARARHLETLDPRVQARRIVQGLR